MDTYTTSRSGGIGDKTKLWEGNVVSTGSTMNLSNSIENYKYILVKDKWESTSSTELRWLEVADVLKVGYFTDTSNYRNSHMFICPYSTCYAYITFKSSTLAIISNENGDAVQIIGIYGVN